MLVRTRIGAAVTATAAVLVLAGCGGGGDKSDSASTTNSGASAAPAASATPSATMPGMPGMDMSASPSATATPSGTVVHIDLVNGKPKVRPEANLKVKSGSLVTIIATADKAASDGKPYEIHIHGFDLKMELTPGHTVTKTFTANQPKGSYEVEVENTSYLLFHLEID